MLAGLAVAAVAGELMCRTDLAIKRLRALSGRDPAALATIAIDGDRLYGMKPDARHGINSSGFRDLERQVSNPTHTYRIAVVGDSVSMQPEIPFEQLWPSRLQRRLDRRFGNGHVEVLNFAVTGYGTRQQLALLREVVLRYSPNALLWQFHLNDAMDPVFDGPDGGLGVYYVRPASYLILYLDKLWTRFRRSAIVRHSGLGGLSVELRVQVGEWHPMTAMLSSVHREAVANGIDAFAIVLPTWPSGPSWDDEKAESRDVYRRLVDRFASLGFATLDLAPALTRLPPAATRAAPDDLWHPSPAGHRVIADEVARWIAPRLRQELN